MLGVPVGQVCPELQSHKYAYAGNSRDSEKKKWVSSESDLYCTE